MDTAEAGTADGGAFGLALVERTGVVGEEEAVVGEGTESGSAAPACVQMSAAQAPPGANECKGELQEVDSNSEHHR